jgi:hypothetical protein
MGVSANLLGPYVLCGNFPAKSLWFGMTRKCRRQQPK